jgi:hypothetical protein
VVRHDEAVVAAAEAEVFRVAAVDEVQGEQPVVRAAVRAAAVRAVAVRAAARAAVRAAAVRAAARAAVVPRVAVVLHCQMMCGNRSSPVSSPTPRRLTRPRWSSHRRSIGTGWAWSA